MSSLTEPLCFAIFWSFYSKWVNTQKIAKLIPWGPIWAITRPPFSERITIPNWLFSKKTKTWPRMALKIRNQTWQSRSISSIREKYAPPVARWRSRFWPFRAENEAWPARPIFLRVNKQNGPIWSPLTGKSSDEVKFRALARSCILIILIKMTILELENNFQGHHPGSFFRTFVKNDKNFWKIQKWNFENKISKMKMIKRPKLPSTPSVRQFFAPPSQKLIFWNF